MYTGATSDFAALFELTQSLVGQSDHGSILKPRTVLLLYCIAVIVRVICQNRKPGHLRPDIGRLIINTELIQSPASRPDLVYKSP